MLAIETLLVQPLERRTNDGGAGPLELRIDAKTFVSARARPSRLSAG